MHLRRAAPATCAASRTSPISFARDSGWVATSTWPARFLDPGLPWLVAIGDETTLGPNVTVLTHDATPKLRTGHTVIAPVRIGARVFIGANVTILPGVTVGDDAIVGAGSVVRRGVAAGTVVSGNPAEEHGTTARHTERHQAQLSRRPRYAEGALDTPEARARALSELEDGPGYFG